MNSIGIHTVDQLSARHGKTILLVDVNPDTRDARAKTLRSLGVTVHCASSASAAWSRYETGSYNLVLVDFGTDKARAQGLADQIRVSNPRQRVAFFVGWPKYLALSRDPHATGPSVESGNAAPSPIAQPKGTDFGQRIKMEEEKAERASSLLLRPQSDVT